MKRPLMLAASAIFIIVGTTVAILYARGFRPDVIQGTLQPTGILVATSDPDGAQVFINGHLTTATNNTMNLTPGDYDIKIVKDGYAPWEKRVKIQKEVVFKTNAFLFPTVPDLRPITFTGAKKPLLSPDGQKIVFAIPASPASTSGNPQTPSGKPGVWILDMTGSPLPFSNNLRQIAKSLYLDFSNSTFEWSPDSKQILASVGKNHYLLDDDRLNDSPSDITARMDLIRNDWASELKLQKQALVAKIPLEVAKIATLSATNLSFSPDGTKILYTATASATIPPIITPGLPSANPTTEDRSVKPNKIYTYDTKEDKNFYIMDAPPVADKKTPAKETPQSANFLSWFPSSRHLLSIEKDKIQIMEYDGTNKAVVYAGPFENSFVFAYPNWGKLVILTTFNQSSGIFPNLYAINLR